MNIIRTIHPVGQGAFYSEEFICDNGNTVLMVYDCGSNSKHSFLRSEISSFFQQRKEIDILFISHFDKDHLNGIAMLHTQGVTIKNVVIPLIDKNNEWFYICSGSRYVKSAIKKPLNFFKAKNVIRVRPLNNDREQAAEEENPVNIEEYDAETIDSGTKISTKAIKPEWYYIPFNFDETARIKQLEQELQSKKIDILQIHDATYLSKNRTVINEAYKKVANNSSNKTSLIVYSGSNNRNSHIANFCNYHNTCVKKCSLCKAYSIRSGCLFLGDTDLNQTRGNGIGILTDLDTYLCRYKDNVGTIQIPHHGSLPNFNTALFSTFPQSEIFYASFGTDNQYGHPSTQVINDINRRGHYYFGVNECKYSGIMETFHI